MTKRVCAFATFVVLQLVLSKFSCAQTSDADALRRGEYLIRIGSCNDCHTPGYGEKGGDVPTSTWLTGTSVGYQGPWGTSYPANLRLSLSTLTEAQWLQIARVPRLPPMPYWSLRDMTDADLKAIYLFIRSLGATGVAMPAAVPPGGKVTTPVIVLDPQTPSAQKVER